METFFVYKVSICIFAAENELMKDKILHRAIDMFLTFGFKSVTMDDISKDLGISKKTIYTHFKNKTELVKETAELQFEIIKTGIEKIRDKGLNAIEELFEIKQYILGQLKNEESSPEYQLQKFFPEIYTQLKTKQLEVVNNCIVNNLTKGINAKIYRSDINIDFTTRIYYTGITGIKDEETFPKTLFNQLQLMEYFLEYHIRAIATDQGLEVLKKLSNNNQ